MQITLYRYTVLSFKSQCANRYTVPGARIQEEIIKISCQKLEILSLCNTYPHYPVTIIFKKLYQVKLKSYLGHLLIDTLRIPSVQRSRGPRRLPRSAAGLVWAGLVWRGRSAAILPAVQVQRLQPFSHLAVVGYLLSHEVLIQNYN